VRKCVKQPDNEGPMSGRALVLSGTCPGQLSGAVCEEGTCPGVGRLSGHLCMHCFYPKSVLVYVYNFYLLVKSLILCICSTTRL